MADAQPLIVIPARMASTRLPGKPLADIHGAPMIVHVWRRACEAKSGRVAVAAAEREIAAAVTAAGGEAVLTKPDHPSGSDRIFEAASLLDPKRAHDMVVNVQGDLPTLDPALVRAVVEASNVSGADIATLAVELRPEGQRGIFAATMPGEGLLGVGHSRRASSERLRRDVWMFAQVLRAFLAKAQAVQGGALASVADADLWSAQASFQFVREFLGHFRAIGYQLVRASDYERLDPFLAALDSLRDVDLIDPDRMRAVLGECDAFYAYLLRLFDQIGQRAELGDRPFDRKAAAEMLKIYLGAA